MIRRYPVRVLTDLSACRYDGGASHTIRAMHVVVAEEDPDAQGDSSLRHAGRWSTERWDGQFEGHVAMGVALFR